MAISMLLSIFPTGVGVNRKPVIGKFASVNIPHRRGGEPSSRGSPDCGGYIFPTGVGVNRESRVALSGQFNIPHRRGGEPDRRELLKHLNEYSPQAWG